LADATRGARGLRRLVLLGNKTPFDLSTLRLLMEVGFGFLWMSWSQGEQSQRGRGAEGGGGAQSIAGG